MTTDRSEQTIARAIAALPVRRPGAGFKAKVMAAIGAESAEPAWREFALRSVVLGVGAWMAAVACGAAALAYTHFPGIAAAVLTPGGLMRALNLAAAHGVLWLAKAASLVSFAASLAGPLLPGACEAAAASLLCAAAISALAGVRPSGAPAA
ncbi:MAG TPA: hypothetical protein PL037_00025 [Elusimicrobiales bacterium]|nr:hypothetical protein [Elusimicrobiales bacterium]